MSDLTLQMGCNLSSPRALCLILLIREREKRVNPQCVCVCVDRLSLPLSDSFALPITGLEGALREVTQKPRGTCAVTTNIRLMVAVTQAARALCFASKVDHQLITALYIKQPTHKGLHPLSRFTPVLATMIHMENNTQYSYYSSSPIFVLFVCLFSLSRLADVLQFNQGIQMILFVQWVINGRMFVGEGVRSTFFVAVATAELIMVATVCFLATTLTHLSVINQLTKEVSFCMELKDLWSNQLEPGRLICILSGVTPSIVHYAYS